MTPEELVAHLQEVDASFVERSDIQFGQASVWVPRDKWVAAATHLKECGRCKFDMFNFMAGVDWPEDNQIEVVVHLYSIRRQHHLNMKIRVARDEGSVPTLSGVWRGANWHERETWELYGVIFEGHPHLVKLLLPEAFEGFPLRKDFLLMTREAKEWEGREEPGPPDSSPRPGRVPASVGASPARAHAAAAVAPAPPPAEGGPAAAAPAEEPAGSPPGGAAEAEAAAPAEGAAEAEAAAPAEEAAEAEAAAPAEDAAEADESVAKAEAAAPAEDAAEADESVAKAEAAAPAEDAAKADESAAKAEAAAPAGDAAKAEAAAAKAEESAAKAEESAAQAEESAARVEAAAPDQDAAKKESAAPEGGPAPSPSDRGDE